MRALSSLMHGFRLLLEPGLRWLTLGPLALNLVVYILLGWYLLDQFALAMDWSMARIPDWLGFLAPLAWVLFALAMLVGFGYSFALLAAVIASPFNGLLAEKIVRRQGGNLQEMPLTARAIAALVARSLARELIKLRYFLPRLLGVLIVSLLLGFIPVIGWLLAPALWLFWASWNMAIQFIDYPADNAGLGFPQTLERMRGRRLSCLGFGAAVAALLSLPFLNLLVLPAAVIGASLLWLEQLDQNAT